MAQRQRKIFRSLVSSWLDSSSSYCNYDLNRTAISCISSEEEEEEIRQKSTRIWKRNLFQRIEECHNPLATWWEEPTHWKRLWSWERLRAEGEVGNRGWDGWMASLNQQKRVWANWEMAKDRRAWCATVHGISKSQTWLSDWTTTTVDFRGHSPRDKEMEGSFHIWYILLFM